MNINVSNHFNIKDILVTLHEKSVPHNNDQCEDEVVVSKQLLRDAHDLIKTLAVKYKYLYICEECGKIIDVEEDICHEFLIDGTWEAYCDEHHDIGWNKQKEHDKSTKRFMGIFRR